MVLQCHSLDVLQDIIAAESKLEVLCFENMEVGNSFYDAIVPPAGNSTGLSPKLLQSRLPHLHSLYFFYARLSCPEGFRRVLFACSIREVGLDRCRRADDYKPLSRIDELKMWAGDEIEIPLVIKRRKIGYDPFDYS